MEIRRTYLDKIKALKLLDDDFMTMALDDKESLEYIFRIILNQPEFRIKEFEVQKKFVNLSGRSIITDVCVYDFDGNCYNLEIQRSDSGAIFWRAELNASLIDSYVSNPGSKYNQLPCITVIFITENDYFDKNLGIYHFGLLNNESLKKVDTRINYIYLNAAYTNDDVIGHLMHDFRETNPEKMNSELLAKRVRYFKETEKGMREMCKIWDDIREDGRKEGLQEGKSEGRKLGKKEGRYETLLKQLSSKFGSLSSQTQEAIENSSIEQLDKLTLSIFNINSIEDVNRILMN